MFAGQRYARTIVRLADRSARGQCGADQPETRRSRGRCSANSGPVRAIRSSPAHRARPARLRHGSLKRRNGGTPASKVVRWTRPSPLRSSMRGQPGATTQYAAAAHAQGGGERDSAAVTAKAERVGRRRNWQQSAGKISAPAKTIADRRGFLKEHMEHQIRHRHQYHEAKGCRLCLANLSAPRAASPNADQPSTSEPWRDDERSKERQGQDARTGMWASISTLCRSLAATVVSSRRYSPDLPPRRSLERPTPATH